MGKAFLDPFWISKKWYLIYNIHFPGCWYTSLKHNGHISCVLFEGSFRSRPGNFFFSWHLYKIFLPKILSQLALGERNRYEELEGRIPARQKQIFSLFQNICILILKAYFCYASSSTLYAYRWSVTHSLTGQSFEARKLVKERNDWRQNPILKKKSRKFQKKIIGLKISADFCQNYSRGYCWNNQSQQEKSFDCILSVSIFLLFAKSPLIGVEREKEIWGAQAGGLGEAILFYFWFFYDLPQKKVLKERKIYLFISGKRKKVLS